jgi:hypothetical protein
VSFLHGIFFAPSFSQATVPELQRLVMADARHLNFGKYTFYSCYGITANPNMFPVGFAFVFGNENLLSWKEFWKFIVELHPGQGSFRRNYRRGFRGSQFSLFLSPIAEYH